MSISENEAVSGEVHEAEVLAPTVLQALTKAELDQQITTARAYPRSVARFQRECTELVRLNEQIAKECVYMVPRDGQMIEGPSSRLAEIVAHAWGNCRAMARVVGEDENFVTAQGVFHDLERNVAINYEVRRRIVGRTGRRYSPDMIATTGNAACSIALRNAVFKGVPKALWLPALQHAKAVIAGDPNTIEKRRSAWLEFFSKRGIPEANVYATLGVAGKADLGIDEMATLEGIQTAVKEGDTTFTEAFGLSEAKDTTSKPAAKGVKGVKEAISQPPKSAAGPAAAPVAATSPAQGAERAKMLVELAKLLGKAGVEAKDTSGRLTSLVGRHVVSINELTQEELGNALNSMRVEAEV